MAEDSLNGISEPSPQPNQSDQSVQSLRLSYFNVFVAFWDKFQIPLYLSALLLGAIIGLGLPATASYFEASINPVLMVLLYATFLSVPLTKIGAALRDLKFLGSLCALNFIAVPAVVYVLTRFIAQDTAVLVGVLLVLLAPCIDYVIVFSGLAGAANDKLLAAAPLLMLLQMLFIPLYIWLFVGSDLAAYIEFAPFLEALVLLIIIPLGLAALTQKAAGKWTRPRSISTACEAFMVPLMMATLCIVVASQIDAVRNELSYIAQVVPIYVAFLVIMFGLGVLVSRVFSQSVAESRAIVFSGATRNSLVVLPLALALPHGFELAAVVVVTQTLVELLGMVAYVQLVPLIIKKT